MLDCEGAYSFVALTKDAIYAVRDPLGLRPLCVGQHLENDGTMSYYAASESCAFDTVGATLVREVAPGEIVRLDSDGIHSYLPFGKKGPPRGPSFCIFEYVYFARPDSIIEGQMVHSARSRLGRQLARESPVPSADIISGVPDSSIVAAIGYAAESKQVFSEVFCKNRYIARTFINPDDTLRKNAIQLKYNPLTHVLAGKKVVLVDDSLVRGNTLAQLVPLLRRGGAIEVHIRICSPPIKHPCYMGVDIGSYEELIAHKLTDVEAIRKYIGADSLAYLSQEGMEFAVNEGVIATEESHGESKRIGHCAACFTGKYPLEHDEF
jgi:amidophosphoribosyltransferase